MLPRHLSWIRIDLRLAALLVLITLVALTAVGWEQSNFSRRQIGITLSDSQKGLRVSGVRTDGPADRAGLRPGDLVRSVHGVPIESLIDYDTAIAEHRGDQRTLFVVERDRTLTDAGVAAGVPFPLFSYATRVFTVFAYLIIGLLALRRRPGSPRSHLLFLLTTAIALEIALPGIHSAIDLWAAGTLLLAGLQMALELHLASIIPERQSWLDRFPWAIPAYYALGVGSATVAALSLVLQHFGRQWMVPWSPDTLYESLLAIGFPLWAGALLFLLARQALTCPEPRGRRQATLVTLGVLPWALMLLADEFGFLDRWIAMRWKDLAWNLAVLPYPLAVLAILYQETTQQETATPEKVLLDRTRQVHETDRVSESRPIDRETLSVLANSPHGLAKECLRCGTCFDAEIAICTHDGTELQLALPIERRIEGRYRLDRRLGKGAMGAVYLASDLHLGRPVVIKVVLGNFASKDVARRFETEAQLTARIRHPNIISVYDYGTTGTDAAYLVLELLDGETLEHRLATRGPLTPSEAAPRFDELCLGVAAAHLHKVVHRDLKPANIFLSRDAKGHTSVKILDFGVARALDEGLSTQERTTPGSLVGTFRYMAPEQLRGEDADERSDVFAIGVVLVESLTGALPFSGNAPPKLLHGIEEGYRYPRPSSEEASEASPVAIEFDRILQRCLHSDPAKRYSTVEALRTDLTPALHRLSEGLTSAEN